MVLCNPTNWIEIIRVFFSKTDSFDNIGSKLSLRYYAKHEWSWRENSDRATCCGDNRFDVEGIT